VDAQDYFFSASKNTDALRPRAQSAGDAPRLDSLGEPMLPCAQTAGPFSESHAPAFGANFLRSPGRARRGTDASVCPGRSSIIACLRAKDKEARRYPAARFRSRLNTQASSAQPARPPRTVGRKRLKRPVQAFVMACRCLGARAALSQVNRKLSSLTCVAWSRPAPFRRTGMVPKNSRQQQTLQIPSFTRRAARRSARWQL